MTVCIAVIKRNQGFFNNRLVVKFFIVGNIDGIYNNFKFLLLKFARSLYKIIILKFIFALSV